MLLRRPLLERVLRRCSRLRRRRCRRLSGLEGRGAVVGAALGASVGAKADAAVGAAAGASA
eukprot:6296830-Pyramimonas_sp.AAC.1